MRTRIALGVYYLAIIFLVVCAGVIIYKLMFWPPCTPTGPKDTSCIADGWSIAGLAATVLGLAGTVLALLGAFAVAAWWTNLNIRVEEQVNKKVVPLIQGSREEAIKVQRALTYLALGDRLLNQNDKRKAFEAYEKAGGLLPNDPQINYVLGHIYIDFGDYEAAIKSFEAALAAEPKYPEAEVELGLAYRRRGEYRQGPDAQVMRNQDYEKAIEHLRRAIALRPDYDDALSTLGGLYRRKGEYEKALELYEEAYRADPSSSYTLGNIASLTWYLGKLDKARQYYMLTELASTAHIMTTHAGMYWDYYDLALAQLALGKTAEAKKSYQIAVGETPGTVQFDSVLNVLYFLQKAKDPIPGLDEVIQMLEKEKGTRINQ